MFMAMINVYLIKLQLYLPNSRRASLINFSKLPDSIDNKPNSFDKLDLDVTLKQT